MGKRKIRLIRLLKVLGVVLVIGILSFISYLKYNKAPILIGSVEYHLTYKKQLTLDIYHPTKKVYEKSPVVIYIHGGAWIMGRKEAINVNRFHGAIYELREQGYAVVSPEYTLASNNNSPFPTCIIDVKDAFEWVRKNADKYHLDVNNMGVFGESAGAHIALLSVVGNNSDTLQKEHDFNYIVDVYGPTNLKTLYEAPMVDSLSDIISKMPSPLKAKIDITRHLFGFDPKLDSVKTNLFEKKYSPIHYIDSTTPEILIIHGNKDRVVPFDQSLALKSVFDSLNIHNEIHILEGVDHAFIKANRDQKSDIQEWIVNFIVEHYKAPSN